MIYNLLILLIILYLFDFIVFFVGDVLVVFRRIKNTLPDQKSQWA